MTSLLDILKGGKPTIAERLTFKNQAETIYVAPDAGAEKSVREDAAYFDKRLVTATKTRDTKTGEITATVVHDKDSVKGANCLILDDICDGGRTFIELAKALKAAGALEVQLYVTHGIFSRGLDVLKPHMSKVYAINLVNFEETGDDYLEVI